MTDEQMERIGEGPRRVEDAPPLPPPMVTVVCPRDRLGRQVAPGERAVCECGTAMVPLAELDRGE